MHSRLFFVFFLFSYVNQSVANKDIWNCEKENGGEWSCVGDKSSDSKQLDSLTDTQSISTPEKTDTSKLKQDTPIAAQPRSIYADPSVQVKSKPATALIHPPKAIVKRDGWSCDPNNESDTWSCSLTGVDPKGKEKIIDGMSDYSGLFASTFDSEEEHVFKTLHSQLSYDPWENCLASSTRPQTLGPVKNIRNTSPMDVSADYSEFFDKEVTSFYGNVKVTRADQKIFSDVASYDNVSETMDAQGHVSYSENEMAIYSDSTHLNLATDEARLRNALFISSAAAIRGKAEVVYRDNKVLSRFKNTEFTSCPPGNQDWMIHAKRLKMNKETGQASAKHAWMEFKGLPVLYTPYVSFPIDNRRLSGFLPPTVGSSDEGGFDTQIPYYWNIAPNYDLTIWPRFMSKRGGMVGGEFRYLTQMAEGSLGLEYLPYDSVRKEPRYSGSFKNKTEFTSNLKSHIDLNYVSDKEYFDELNNALGFSTDRHLKSVADLAYDREGVSLTTRLQTYQTIDKTLLTNEKPYQQLPQVSLNLDHSFESLPIDLAVDSDYVYFYRDDQVRGHRFNVKPSIAFPIETAGSFIKPKISLQHTEYSLEKQVVGQEDKFSRTLPIISVDSGLFFERETRISGSDFLHTIEPRLFYLYIPEKNQQNIPIFDSSLYDVNFNSLFRENRFSSIDRIQDANQITVAMTSRLIDSENGQENLNLSVGEIFYFKDREVMQTGTAETNNYSDLVAELNGQITDQVSFTTGVHWSPDDNDFTRGQAAIKYSDKAEKIINLGYRYRKNDLTNDANIIQTDASFRWPIYDNWFGVGRWQYSLKFNSTKESFLGLEKESCCWRFRVIWRRYANTISDTSDDVMDEGVFIQLELKGLTSFGDKVDEFLEKNLSGYRRTEK